jgi:valyl-tRNA synthetase
MAENPVRKGKIKFWPKNFEKGYFNWLKNIKDWCISRQIWWGHRLPVWYCQTEKNSNFKFPISKQKRLKNLKIKSSLAEKFIVATKKPKKCPFCGNCKMAQSADVLDTWFSSALWPFATLGWPLACLQNRKYCKPKKNSDLERFYPTDVLSTDRGIINLWVARMIFSGMELMGKIPFKDVYIHATVLTREGKRMSKSLGTGIDPTDLIERYGADAARWGIAWQIRGGQDIKFVEDNIVMGRKFCNKIWNASRFVLLQFPISNFQFPNKSQILKSKNLTRADKKILKALNTTIKSVNRDLENFRFGPAAQKLYDFFWHDFCDLYIETSKFQIKKGKLEKERSKKILLYVLLTSLKLLHPFIPFITEEIYQKLPLKNKKECLMIEKWPT